MVQLSRRRLLQGAGATLATWGFHQAIDRQQAVLAQPSDRKFALLVGINKYSRAPLRGCVNDVILQYNLLVHRFGFDPDNVKVVLDEDATRDSILTAFEEHLIDQAKPGDVAFFHYSGHGALVRDPDGVFTNRRDQGINGTFVPIDGRLASRDARDREPVQDIMGRTLFLLMSAIETEHFTAVLDSCHSGGADRPELTVRSVDDVDASQIAQQELDYQNQWLARLDLSLDDFIRNRQRGIAKGVVLTSAQEAQLAVDDTSLNGFVAGAFTYRLTQHLWQQNTTPAAAIAEINRIMPTHYRQTPQLETKPETNHAHEPILFIEPPYAPADAIVKLIEANGQATVIVVGVNPETVNAGTVLTTPNRTAQVIVTERQGLFSIGRVSGRLREGDLLRVQ